jgi:RNA polymerase sigma factor (sigma-70 family)
VPGGVPGPLAPRLALRPAARGGARLADRHRPQPGNRPSPRPGSPTRAEAAAVAIAALEPPDDPVSRAGADRAEAGRLRRLLDDLPDEQRDALLLVHHGGLSQREIARVTGLPLGTVRSRLRLGLARVRLLAGA